MHPGFLALGATGAAAATYAIVGLTSPAPDPVDPLEHGLVLLDRDARDAGVAVLTSPDEPARSGALPLVFPDGTEVELIDAEGERTALKIEGQVLVHVVGAQARVERWVVGEDVVAERVLVEGEPDALETLAETIGGEIIERDGRLFEIASAEALLTLALAAEGHGGGEIVEVSPAFAARQPVEVGAPSHREGSRAARELAKAPPEGPPPVVLDLRPDSEPPPPPTKLWEALAETDPSARREAGPADVFQCIWDLEAKRFVHLSDEELCRLPGSRRACPGAPPAE